ncbi:MAG: hypothetical protein GDA44_14955 [Prochloron sp. SP5CPC1]|nr:hypothetical protein [Candidatus Paraprochloron terpiosi SP5CPC1]
MPNLIKLMQVVGTFEVSPIFTVNQDDPWRFRIEILKEYPSGKYIPRVYRWECFRVRPTFPQDENGESSSELADHDFLIQDIGLDSDDNDISGDSIEEVLNKVQQRLEEMFFIDRSEADLV